MFKKSDPYIYISTILITLAIVLFQYVTQFDIVKTYISCSCMVLFFSLYLAYDNKKKFNRAGYSENWHEFYGREVQNIPYSKNGKIKNSFKREGINYKEEIGNLNEGKDYEKNNNNYYDIYLPYSCLKRKDKVNHLILFIKSELFGELSNSLTIRYAKYGYITVQMKHSFLNKDLTGCSVFRILDEITACIENIKSNLKSLGFDENKLELAIGGTSIGAYLSIFYSFFINNIPLPVKFLINYCGPISLESKFWYKLGYEIPPFDNIDIKDIETGIKNNKIIPLFNNEKDLIDLMNKFLGNKYSKKELNQMIINKKINMENEKFKEMENIIKYCYASNFINKKLVPILCYYGGKDYIIGLAHYAELKKLCDKYENRVELVYMKNGEHLLSACNTKDDTNAIKEIHYQILNFAETYFTRDN